MLPRLVARDGTYVAALLPRYARNGPEVRRGGFQTWARTGLPEHGFGRKWAPPVSLDVAKANLCRYTMEEPNLGATGAGGTVAKELGFGRVTWGGALIRNPPRRTMAAALSREAVNVAVRALLNEASMPHPIARRSGPSGRSFCIRVTSMDEVTAEIAVQRLLDVRLDEVGPCCPPPRRRPLRETEPGGHSTKAGGRFARRPPLEEKQVATEIGFEPTWAGAQNGRCFLKAVFCLRKNPTKEQHRTA